MNGNASRAAGIQRSCHQSTLAGKRPRKTPCAGDCEWCPDLPVRLRKLHSHWLCRAENVVLFRGRSYHERGVRYLLRMRPSEQRRGCACDVFEVPPALRKRSAQMTVRRSRLCPAWMCCCATAGMGCALWRCIRPHALYDVARACRSASCWPGPTRCRGCLAMLATLTARRRSRCYPA